MPGPDRELLLANALREAALDAHARPTQAGTPPTPPLGPAVPPPPHEDGPSPLAEAV
ncbi:MAG: hypothetical protein QOD76_970 [Solirubrobacteraceae bacterium]|jgi:hypothetical protein|nr:hypothetical protein [Solirubrobacteraceae bacterium]